MSVELKLLNTNRSKKSLKYLWAIAGLIMFNLILITLIFFILPPVYFSVIVGTVSLSMPLGIFSYSLYKSNLYDQEGVIKLNEHEIKIIKGETKIQFDLSSINKLEIKSNYYDGYSKDDRYGDGIILFSLFSDIETKYNFRSVIPNKHIFVSLQEILLKYYKVITIEEDTLGNHSRPLVLESRSFDKLQELKKELNIKGNYF